MTIGEAKQWQSRTWAILLVLLLIRVGYLLFFPLDTAGDESYYWDWSRQLDWAYYSKPPLIAWVIYAGTAVSDSLFWLKLPAALMNVAAIGILGALASRMFHARAGFWTVLVAGTMPGSVIGGMTMTIDAPLLLAWSAALYFLWACLDERHRLPPWGSAAGALVSVGAGLLAKLSMGLFWISYFLYLMFPGKERHRPSPYFWIPFAGASFLFLTPFIYWNINNNWITFLHTGSSFGPSSWSIGRGFTLLFEFLASQFGAVNPVWFILMFVIVIPIMRHWKQTGRRVRFLVAFSVPLILAAVVLSFFQRVQPNWPAAFYLSTIILIGAWLGNISLYPDDEENLHKRGNWRFWGTLTGAIFCALVYLLPPAIDKLGLAGNPTDPFARMRGWQDLAQEVQDLRDSTFGDTPHFLWVGGHRYHTSQLAWHLPDQPTVFRFQPRDNPVESQYELWKTPAEAGHFGYDALLLIPPEMVDEQLAEWSRHFQSVQQLPNVVVRIGDQRTIQLRAYRGIGLRIPLFEEDLSWP